MKHRHGNRILGRVAADRKQLLANLSSSLLEHGAIVTSEAKAKELRKFVEPLITKAKQELTLGLRRQLLSALPRKADVGRLVEVASASKMRPGGYVRLTRLPLTGGDAAVKMRVEIIDYGRKSKNTEWHLIDAEGKVLGRVATRAAYLLMGKHRADFANHIPAPVYVVITNAATVHLSGSKETQKMYRHHTGYPGHLKERPVWQQREKDPTKIIQLAVAGMLPKNNLRKVRMNHLKVYVGAEHPHMAQIPKK